MQKAKQLWKKYFQENATFGEHVKDVVASLSVEALVILFWHGCWSLLDAWSESLGLDHTISSWYAMVRKISGERKLCHSF